MQFGEVKWFSPNCVALCRVDIYRHSDSKAHVLTHYFKYMLQWNVMWFGYCWCSSQIPFTGLVHTHTHTHSCHEYGYFCSQLPLSCLFTREVILLLRTALRYWFWLMGEWRGTHVVESGWVREKGWSLKVGPTLWRS